MNSSVNRQTGECLDL